MVENFNEVEEQSQAYQAYKDQSLRIEERVNDLVSRMTLEEKVSQMLHSAPAIPHLDIPEYNWWNECLHGVARAGTATVFPQAIAMAASFNSEFLFEVATIISDEARAKHHEAVRHGDRGIYKGLTFWSPNINIYRDPRWGRGHETYGEDPYLTSQMGIAFVKGLQGDNPKYLKLVATPKHYAVHSGPEYGRHSFDARASAKDLKETYLYAFKECVKHAKAQSIMCAYNRFNGEVCCGHSYLLQDILRDEWSFDGYVVSDCGAICDFHMHHKVTKDGAESAALAVKNGCDLNCGNIYANLLIAVDRGMISEVEIDRSVKRLFRARFKLGMFDSPEKVPYTEIPYEGNACKEHRKLSLKMSRESLVLLKNDGLLPLSKNTGSIAVIGPNADSLDGLLGNYSGTPLGYVTPLKGIKSKMEEIGKDVKVVYEKGCDLVGDSKDGFERAISVARECDIAVVCLGLNADIEGEEGDPNNPFPSGDRDNLDLPGLQQELLEEVYKTGTPTVLVLLNGGPLAITWADKCIPAIIEAWYPGEEGGNAIADVLFGDYCPAGRLPITFVRDLKDLPEFTDYNMKGRTYKYFDKEPLYPFGYGLSYTSFAYSELQLDKEVIEVGESISCSVKVKNTGCYSGDEVVQLYLMDKEASVEVPRYELYGFERITLTPHEEKEVRFTISPRQMALIDNDGRCVIEPGEFILYLGGCQPDRYSQSLMDRPVISRKFIVKGENPVEIGY